MTARSTTIRTNLNAYRPFFLIAALYDLVLGLAFFFFWPVLFPALEMEAPTNASYVLLSAAFIAVQGFGYFLVWRDPARNIAIVTLGAVYKATYIVVALVSIWRGELPHDLFAWFAISDALFMIGFLRFLAAARRAEA